MTNLRKAAQQAMEALELNNSEWKSLADSGDAGYWRAEDQDYYKQTSEAITALRAALVEQDDDLTAAWMAGAAEERKRAEQAQPVAWRDPSNTDPGQGCTYVPAVRDKWPHVFTQPLYTTPPAPQSLRDLCAAAYQVVGVADGPVEMLDNLWAAAEGKPLPHDPGAGLPWSPPAPQALTIERLRDALVASRIIDPGAVEDPDAYDDGVTLHRIEALYRRLG